MKWLPMQVRTPPLSTRELQAWLLLTLLFVVAVSLSWRAHRAAGAWFPPPWPDESAFGWQAIAFSEHGSLVSPELNPHRVVHWMPPGYAVLTGMA